MGDLSTLLVLSSNKITNLSNGGFDDISELFDLKLSNNQINDLGNGVFGGTG